MPPRSRILGVVGLLLLTQCRPAGSAADPTDAPPANNNLAPVPETSPTQEILPTVPFLAAQGNVYASGGVPSADDVVSRLSEFFSVRYGVDGFIAVVDGVVTLSPNTIATLMKNPPQDANGVHTFTVALTDIEGGTDSLTVDDEVPQDSSGYDADARDATWPVPMDANYAVEFLVNNSNTAVVKWPVALEKAVAHAMHLCDGSGSGNQQVDCTNNFDGVPVSDFVRVLLGVAPVETPGPSITVQNFAGVGVDRIAVLTFPPSVISTAYPDGSRVTDEEWQTQGFGLWIQDGNQSYGLLPTSYAVTAADPNGTLTLRAPQGFGIVANQTMFYYCDSPYCSAVTGAGPATFTLPIKWAQRLADHLTTAPVQ